MMTDSWRWWGNVLLQLSEEKLTRRPIIRSINVTGGGGGGTMHRSRNHAQCERVVELSAQDKNRYRDKFRHYRWFHDRSWLSDNFEVSIFAFCRSSINQLPSMHFILWSRYHKQRECNQKLHQMSSVWSNKRSCFLSDQQHGVLECLSSSHDALLAAFISCSVVRGRC